LSDSLTQPSRGLSPSLVATLGMAAAVGGALAFEHIGGYIPCALCLMQRTPYYWGIPIGILAIVTSVVKLPVWLTRSLLAIVGVLMLVGAGLGVYHAGVEWKFWKGPTTCGAGAPAAPVGNILDALKNPPRFVPCDEAAWRFLGLSLAGYNALISGAMAALSFAAARKV